MEKLNKLYEGKAKEVYKTSDPNCLIVAYKDDATAFNGEKKGTISGKGAINNQLTNHFMQMLEKNNIPTHFVKEISKNETLVKKIKKTEMKICDILDFNLLKSTCVLILHRFIQIMNISNKNIESIFKSISYFFLEISIYEEQFYLFDDFVKALSSLIITKLILQQHNIKLGFHNYLRQCTKIKNEQIKQYFNLCQKIIKDLKHLKYGTIIFSKYQMKSFNSVVNTYLNEFINKCFKNKGIISLNNV